MGEGVDGISAVVKRSMIPERKYRMMSPVHRVQEIIEKRLE